MDDSAPRCDLAYGGSALCRVAPAVDLKSLQIPILAVNGSFDNPYAKTQRFWREARVFQNVILTDKTHLTAIATGANTPPLYIASVTSFIDAHDVR